MRVCVCVCVCVCVFMSETFGSACVGGRESPDSGQEQSPVAKIQIYSLTFILPI